MDRFLRTLSSGNYTLLAKIFSPSFSRYDIAERLLAIFFFFSPQFSRWESRLARFLHPDCLPSGKQFLSDKLLLCARSTLRSRFHGAKIGVVSLHPFPDITSLRRVALYGDAGGRSGASGEGSRTVEKVDQYQAKRSAPTNLCGDPSNDTLSLQPE